MKRGLLLWTLLLWLVLLLGACAKQTLETPAPTDVPARQPGQTQADNPPDDTDQQDVPEQKTSVFSAAVLEVQEQSLLVAPDENSSERRSADEIMVDVTEQTVLTDFDGSTCTLSGIATGSIVEITYTGDIAETYPAQLTAQRIAVTALPVDTQSLLTPVEGEWADAGTLTCERVTVADSEDAFVLRALEDLEKVELARVSYDEEKQDYVQKDLLWMADVWAAGSELAVIEQAPLDRPDLAISWQDEYGERERRLVLPLRTKVGDTLTRSVMITSYMPPFAPVELSAQVDAEGNGTQAVQTDNYKGVDAYGFAPTRTEILCRMNYDLDLCGRKESVQLLRLWDEYDQYSFALRVVKNGVSYDLGVLSGLDTHQAQLPHYAPQLWLADLDGDKLVEIYFGGDMASDDFAFSGWTIDNTGLTGLTIDGEMYIDARIVSVGSGAMQLERTLHVLGTHHGTSAYCFGPNGELEQLDAFWQIQDESGLSLIRPLPVVMSDNTQAELPAGTQLYVTATDGESAVFFRTDGGQTGEISIARDESNEGWMIAGVSENEYFETLPYAG